MIDDIEHIMDLDVTNIFFQSTWPKLKHLTAFQWNIKSPRDRSMEICAGIKNDEGQIEPDSIISQYISIDLYKEFLLNLHKEMVNEYFKRGKLTKKEYYDEFMELDFFNPDDEENID